MKVSRAIAEAKLKDTSRAFLPLANALMHYGYNIVFQDETSVILQAGNNKVLAELITGNAQPPGYHLSRMGAEETLTEVRNILFGNPGFVVDLGDSEKITVMVRESMEAPGSIVKQLLHE